MADHREAKVCGICGKTFAPRDLIPGIALRDAVAQQIAREHPDWSQEKFICRPDLNCYPGAYVHSLLESEKGELTSLENEVLTSLRNHETLSKNIDTEFEGEWTLGERLADRIATFGGSWIFLILFGLFLVVWISINSFILYTQPPDPYPYILLNLILSCLAAIQAPIIMMSQNRQEAKVVYVRNTIIRLISKPNWKFATCTRSSIILLSHQWERLAQIQEIQLELLAEISRRR
jgi:uncharacterized protein DUF1003